MSTSNAEHLDLTVSPGIIYGTRPGALYCPVRDGTVHMIQGNTIWLQYTLLSAETSAIGKIAAQTFVPILHRRSQIYRVMSRLVADPRTRCNDHTITGLGFAALVENRMGNIASARKHAIAARNLVRIRSESDPIPDEISMPTFCILVAIGLDAQALPHRSLLEGKIEMFVSDLANVQRWASQSTTVSALSLFHSARGLSGHSKNYFLAKSRVLGRFSLLHSYLMPQCNEQADTEKRCHAALIWILNKILYGLRDDYEQSIFFLNALHRHVESAIEPSPEATGNSVCIAQSPRLKWTRMLAIVRKIGASFWHESPYETTHHSCRPWDGKSSDHRWWEVFDMLELLHLLSFQRREKVLEQLSEFLVDPERPCRIARMCEHELKHLADEMRMTWMEKMLTKARPPSREAKASVGT
jgi:hypothetical protein